MLAAILQRQRNSSTLCVAILGIALCVLASMYYQCIDSEAVGFIHDDGEYLISGKSLAEGHGFRLIHLPTQPLQTRYPVAYPLLLSLGWRLNPEFPNNVLFLKGLTACFALASLLLLFFYLRDSRRCPGGVALVITLLVGTSYQFVAYSTSLMSEAPFLFFSLLTLMAGESLVARPTVRRLLLAVVLVAVCFHTRSVGVALATATCLVLVVRQGWRWAGSYGLGFLALAILPWFAWVHGNSPGAVDSAEATLLRPYMGYLDMATLTSGSGLLATLGNGFENLNSLFLDNLLPILPNALKLLPDGLLGEQSLLVWGFVVALQVARYALLGYLLLLLVGAVRRRELSVLAVYTLISLFLIAQWNVRDSMPRFLIVVLPFLWMYLLQPLLPALRERGLAARPQVAALVVLVLLAVWPAAVGFHVLESNRSRHVVASFSGGQVLWPDYQATFEFVERELPASTPIAAREDAVFYLYTGRPTVYLHSESLAPGVDPEARESYRDLLEDLVSCGVGYVIMEPTLHAPGAALLPNPVVARLLAACPERFERAYSSPHGLVEVYRVLPQKS